MFTEIHHIDDLRSFVGHKEEIRFNTQDNGFQVVCYMISDNDTFNDVPSLECRGITFDSDGNIASRPLHKFFNLGERESTLKENIDWTDVVRVMDKRDGSMAHAVLVDGQVKMKSKKSFESDVAKMMNAYIQQHPKYQAFCKSWLEEGWTPIFEWTTPRARIVLPYEEDELVLLHLRDNTTGEYMMSPRLDAVAEEWEIPVVENILNDDFNIDDLLAHCETAEGIEGYIVQFSNGDMVKIKTPWYLALHRTVTFTRERDVAEMALNEDLDDYKSYLTEVGVSHDKVIEIEKRVAHDIMKLQCEVDRVILEGLGMERKDFAIKYNKHPLFGLIMPRFIGKDPDYKTYFERNILKQEYSLDQL